MITEMDLRKSVLPLISIIRPTYKRAAFLSRAVDSALNQSYPNIEAVSDTHLDVYKRQILGRVGIF